MASTVMVMVIDYNDCLDQDVDYSPCCVQTPRIVTTLGWGPISWSQRDSDENCLLQGREKNMTGLVGGLGVLAGLLNFKRKITTHVPCGGTCSTPQWNGPIQLILSTKRDLGSKLASHNGNMQACNSQKRFTGQKESEIQFKVLCYPWWLQFECWQVKIWWDSI